MTFIPWKFLVRLTYIMVFAIYWGEIVLLDTRTMYLLLCLGNFIMFVMLVVFARATHLNGLFRRYAYGKLFQGLGMSMVLFRGIVPEGLSVIVGNSLFFVGVILEAFCLMYVGKVPSYRTARVWIRISLFLIVGFVLIYLAGVDIAVRSAVVSFVIAIVSLTIAGGLLFYNNETKLRRFSGAFFIIFALLHVFRAMEALSGQTDYLFFGATPAPTLSLLMAYVYMLISTMAFLLMSREAVDLKLQQAATRDFLTGIYNRGQFMHLAKKIFGLMIRQKQPVSVLMLDLDRFKSINDKYGHFVGDEVLMHFSSVTTAALRGEDVFGRYGGEEFIIISPNTSNQEAMVIGHRVKAALASAVAQEAGLPHYKVSIGTASIIPTHISEMTNLIKMADAALLQAKRSGRNRVVRYDEM